MSKRIPYSFGPISLGLIVLLLLLGSCSTTKDVAYIQSAEREMIIARQGLYDAHIQAKDLITVTIQSTNPDAVAAFNGIYWNPQQEYAAGAQEIKRFLVDNDGRVDLPVIGMIQLGGLTLRDAESRVKQQLSRYIKDVTSVNIRIHNYRYSVLGEVTHPGTFTAENGKVTIFEALSRAGDITIYGLSREVRLLREEPDGSQRVVVLNLQDPTILSSPYLYLQQGDILYVMPNNAKASSRNISAGTTIWLNVASLAFSLANILVTILR